MELTKGICWISHKWCLKQSFLLQGNDVAKPSHYSTSKGSKQHIFYQQKKTDYKMPLIKWHSSLVCHKPTTDQMTTQNIPKGQISRYVPPEESDLRCFLGATESNSMPWLFLSRGGLGDSTTLGHKDCENMWDLFDLCLTCGNQVILPTTFPPKNGWRLWRLSSRKIL